MELELLDFPVQNVVFGEKTALEGTVLTINREEMARKSFRVKVSRVSPVLMHRLTRRPTII